MKTKIEYILDIEILPNCFLVCCLDAYSDKKFHFEVWKNRNDISKFYKFLHFSIDVKIRHITFNGLAFDSQIIQWIIDNEHRFTSSLTTTDCIIDCIYKYAQECIRKSNTREWLDYAPWKLLIPQLDIYKMGHWDSDSKRAGLKWLQCNIDWSNLEDMPFHHTHYIKDEKELLELRGYCYNDCAATKKVFQICKEAIDLRRDLSKEFDIDLYSASEPKMSKELFLYFLSNKTGTDKWEMNKWRTARTDIHISKILLPYVNFQRQEFKMLLKNFREKIVQGDALKGAFKYTVKYKGITIEYGMGGVHAMTEPAIYKTTDTHIIKSVDVKSFYPNMCIVNQWSPAHIPKQAFCDQYKSFYIDRTKYKKGTAKNKALKLLLNSTFGLTIDKFSFLSDPQMGVQITVNGQLLLTMLLEMLCEGIPDARPLMLNTDGIELLIHKDHEKLCEQICKDWEKITQLELEYAKYDTILAFDVNNYIAKDEQGVIKGKGRFEYEPHDKYAIDVLHKNKSFLIIPKGIAAYILEGIPPEQFVKNHSNVYDFCGFSRARGQWQFIQVWSTSEGVHEKELQKTLRYYVSNSGCKVIKRKTTIETKINDDFEKVDLETERNIQVLAGKNHITEFNKYIEKNIDQYNINYNWYVKEIYKELNMLQYKKVKSKLMSKTDLFS